MAEAESAAWAEMDVSKQVKSAIQARCKRIEFEIITVLVLIVCCSRSRINPWLQTVQARDWNLPAHCPKNVDKYQLPRLV